MGSITKTTVLYGDVLFLKDMGPSLQAALFILDSFTVLSGLKVNRSMSKILPVRSHSASGGASQTAPLQWVSQIKHLGLVVTNSVAAFIPPNVSLLLNVLKNRLSALKNPSDRED